MSLFNHNKKDESLEQKVTEKIAETIGTHKIKNALDLKTSADEDNLKGPRYEFSIRIPDYEFIFRILKKK